ncbi:Ceramide synthase 1 [Desmophyllum pertusum]|uniref:Ceramide synthase 1 n=1 Tax=Desmophyllum pertusum TaxID=174260 RepID=A0A9W9Y845_9CNID|nr:Ceramide synthase 1 [Desmophyllum pertusum]
MEVGYSEAFTKIWNHCWIEWQERAPTKTFLTDFINDPFFSWCQFLEKDQKKCPESAFKLLFYSSAYGYCCYILFNGKYNFFQDTGNCWTGWYKGMPVPQDIYMLYLAEAGFYFHSVYATLFMDQWRRDSILMILHHILANLLILFSFAIRYYKIGVVVLFLHDVSDVVLECTKLCLAAKSRGGKYRIIPDILSIVGFLSFASLWFYCRLYVYPIKVLYSCGYTAPQQAPELPFYFFFNTMLWMLFLMNVWWFHFIVWLIIRIVFKKGHVEDTREIPKETEKDKAPGKIANGKVLENGEVSAGNGTNHATHRNYNKEDSKRREENGECIEKDHKEQFRRRQPHTNRPIHRINCTQEKHTT